MQMGMNDKKSTRRYDIPVDYPQTEEIAGHVFHHLAGGLYQADEEFELTNKEARSILREYRKVRLIVRRKPGCKKYYSDYANWRQKTRYCSLTVGYYDVYQVLYAYEFGYQHPELENILRDSYCYSNWLRWQARRKKTAVEETAKIKACCYNFDMMDIICHYVFSEIDGKKGIHAEPEELPQLRRAFEWIWPEEGIPGYIRLGDHFFEKTEEGIYKAVEYYSLGKFWDHATAYIYDLSLPDGVTADDVAYIQDYYMDGGGWGFPDENNAVYIAIGKEHFDRLREIGGADFMYHPYSKLRKQEKDAK